MKKREMFDNWIRCRQIIKEKGESGLLSVCLPQVEEGKSVRGLVASSLLHESVDRRPAFTHKGLSQPHEEHLLLLQM